MQDQILFFFPPFDSVSIWQLICHSPQVHLIMCVCVLPLSQVKMMDTPLENEKHFEKCRCQEKSHSVVESA